MGAFNYLEWTYDGAFEQLFGLRRGGENLNKNFSKIQMSGGLPGRGFLSFDLTGTLLNEVFVISRIIKVAG